MARFSLTTKQSAFVRAYLENGGNGAAAYRAAYGTKAGDAQAAHEAFRLLKHKKIAPLIAEADQRRSAARERVLKKYELNEEEVIHRLCLLAGYDLSDVMSWGPDGIRVKPIDEITDEAAYAITEIRQSENGAISFKMADKRAALMDIAKLRGWITDRTQQLGPDGRPINPQAVTLVVVRK
jgi:phage terminase small subunit